MRLRTRNRVWTYREHEERQKSFGRRNYDRAVSRSALPCQAQTLLAEKRLTKWVLLSIKRFPVLWLDAGIRALCYNTCVRGNYWNCSLRKSQAADEEADIRSLDVVSLSPCLEARKRGACEKEGAKKTDDTKGVRKIWVERKRDFAEKQRLREMKGIQENRGYEKEE